MGILSFGIFDGFEKRTGPLVGRIVNKKHVISMVQHKSTVPFTHAQLIQQAKFKVMVMFLIRMRQLISLGFAGKRNQNPFNAAVSYNAKHIVIGSYPNYSIDYSKVLYNKGRVDGPISPEISMDIDSVIFSWQAGNQSQYNRLNDLTTFLVYNPNYKESFIEIAEAKRSALTYTMLLPSGYSELELHCYMSFMSADRNTVGNSTYLGHFHNGTFIN